MFVVIDDLARVDALAESKLLWFTHEGADRTCPWEWAEDHETPSQMQARFKDYTFYILLEE